MQTKRLAVHIVGLLHVVQLPKINHGLARLVTRPENFTIPQEKNTIELEQMPIDSL